MIEYMKQFGSPAWVVESENFTKFVDVTYPECFFGEIWLYNNDLRIISDYDTFKPLYYDRISSTLAQRVDAVKVLVKETNEIEVFGHGGALPQGELRDNLLAIANRPDATGPGWLSTLYFGRMREAALPPILKSLPDSYTMVFYNHRDSIGMTPGIVMVRHNVFPFQMEGENKVFATVWQMREQEDIQRRLRQAFNQCFNDEDTFHHVLYDGKENAVRLVKGWSSRTRETKTQRKQQRCLGLCMGDHVDIAVVASQWAELRPLRDAMDKTYPTPLIGDHYEYSVIESGVDGRLRKVLLAVVGEGNISAACRMWDILAKWSPKSVILFGVAGGDSEDANQRLGDIIVCEKIVGYEHGKLVDGLFRKRPTVYDTDLGLVVAAERVSARCNWKTLRDYYPSRDGLFTNPRLHRFAMASGSKLVADKGFLPGIRESTHEKVHATEMEGDGVGYACKNHTPSPRFLVVKGIMDFSTSKSRDECLSVDTAANAPSKDDWKNYAARAVSVLVRALLDEI